MSYHDHPETKLSTNAMRLAGSIKLLVRAHCPYHIKDVEDG